MLPRKLFANLHTAMAILVLFEHFSGTFYLNFCPYMYVPHSPETSAPRTLQPGGAAQKGGPSK